MKRSEQTTELSSLAVLLSQHLFNTLPSLYEGLCSFTLVSLEDWVRSLEVISGGDSISTVAAAGIEYVACFVTSDEMECGGARHALRLGIPVFELDGDGTVDELFLISEHLIQSLSSRLDSSRRHAVREMISSARLRREYEDLQRRFSRLEFFVYSLGGPQVSLAEEHTPTTDVMCLKQHHWSFLTQALSTSISGLIALEVYICDSSVADTRGYLELELRDTAENPVRTAALRISSLNHGWNKFMLGDAVDCSDQEGTIILRLRDAAPESSVCLSLGKATALPQLRLTTPAPTHADAPLAFRSWRGIAGCRVQGADRLISGGKVEFIRPSSLPFPCMLRCTDTKMTFAPVQFWSREDAVLVHPPARGITIGSIEKLRVVHLGKVRAILHNGHREAPLLRFGLKVVPSSSSFAVRTDLNSGDESSFVWTTLPANSWGELTFKCNPPLSGDVDLILAALVADGESSHMAWALFRGFSLYQGI